jgi:hypothetical protein
MPVLLEESRKEKFKFIDKANAAAIERIKHLTAAAITSAVISSLIALTFRNSIGLFSFHLLFLSVVATLGLIAKWSGFSIRRIDVGIVIALFVFEPVGRLLLEHQAPSAHSALALPLLLVFAYFFGRSNSSGNRLRIE